MPLIKVQSSVKSPDSEKVKELLATLSSKLSEHLGKPESYVMTSFEPEIAMTFAGKFDPVCYVEIKSIGTMKPALTKAMSKDFCEQISKFLEVSKNRIYIEFTDAKGYMWGWDSRTFG